MNALTNTHYQPLGFSTPVIAMCQELSEAGFFPTPVIEALDRGTIVKLHPVLSEGATVGYETEIEIGNKDVVVRKFSGILDPFTSTLTETLPPSTFAFQDITAIATAICGRAIDLHAERDNWLDEAKGYTALSLSVSKAAAHFNKNATLVLGANNALPSSSRQLFGEVVAAGMRRQDLQEHKAAQMAKMVEAYKPFLRFCRTLAGILQGDAAAERFIPEAALTGSGIISHTRTFSGYGEDQISHERTVSGWAKSSNHHKSRFENGDIAFVDNVELVLRFSAIQTMMTKGFVTLMDKDLDLVSTTELMSPNASIAIPLGDMKGLYRFLERVMHHVSLDYADKSDVVRAEASKSFYAVQSNYAIAFPQDYQRQNAPTLWQRATRRLGFGG